MSANISKIENSETREGKRGEKKEEKKILLMVKGR